MLSIIVFNRINYGFVFLFIFSLFGWILIVLFQNLLVPLPPVSHKCFLRNEHGVRQGVRLLYALVFSTTVGALKPSTTSVPFRKAIDRIFPERTLTLTLVRCWKPSHLAKARSLIIDGTPVRERTARDGSLAKMCRTLSIVFGVRRRAPVFSLPDATYSRYRSGNESASGALALPCNF